MAVCVLGGCRWGKVLVALTADVERVPGKRCRALGSTKQGPGRKRKGHLLMRGPARGWHGRGRHPAATGVCPRQRTMMRLPQGQVALLPGVPSAAPKSWDQAGAGAAQLAVAASPHRKRMPARLSPPPAL